MIYCDKVNPKTGLRCEGLKGHTGDHAAMNWKGGYMTTWTNEKEKNK